MQVQVLGMLDASSASIPHHRQVTTDETNCWQVPMRIYSCAVQHVRGNCRIEMSLTCESEGGVLPYFSEAVAIRNRLQAERPMKDAHMYLRIRYAM
jgi:hypothetical protein